MKKYDYIAVGGESSFTSEELIGKDILSVLKDGDGCSKIVTGTPINNQAQYNISFGSIGFAMNLERGTAIKVLYQDKANVCFPPLIPFSFINPDVNAGFPYNASFYISGSSGFTISAVTKPAWLTYSLYENLLIFSGTPAITDSGSNNVKFTISNACGSVGFDKAFNVGVLDANFGTRTYISGDRLNESEQVLITGTPGVVVTIQVTTYTNTNGGTLTANGNTVSSGYSFILTISLTGVLLICEINGIDAPGGTVIRGIFTITAVSGGAIGATTTYQTSKVF